MGKRASASSKAAASPTKSARVAASAGKSEAKASPAPLAKKDPLYEVYKVLKARSDASAAEMLIAALPLAMKVAEGSEQRHDFQDRILEAATKELSSAVASQREGMEALEKEAADLEEEKARSSTVEQEIAVRLGEKKQGCEATEEAMRSQEEALKGVQAALEAAQKSATAAEGERQGLEMTRDDFAERLTDLWQPLKASELAGGKWRDRDRKLAQLLKKFQEIGIEESLLAATQAALKLKADVRGEFALAAVSCAEEAYTKHIETLKERVDAFGSEISARAAAVEGAETGAKTAKEAVDEATQANTDAQNVWAEEASADASHKSKMKAYEPTWARLQKKLGVASTQLALLQGVSSSFESQRSIKPATPEDMATSEAVAAAEPPEEAPAEEPADVPAMEN